MPGEGLRAGAMSWDRAFRVTGRMLAHVGDLQSRTLLKMKR